MIVSSDENETVCDDLLRFRAAPKGFAASSIGSVAKRLLCAVLNSVKSYTKYHILTILFWLHQIANMFLLWK